MFGQHGSVHEVSWETVKKRLGDVTFQKLWNQAHFIGMVNWTMLPHLSAIWKRLLSDYMPAKPTTRKLMFFDLCDPSKRLDADLHAALKIIGEFQAHNDVILGLNEAESLHVAKGASPEEDPGQSEGHRLARRRHPREARAPHRRHHPVSYAAGADAQGEVFVNGPYTAKPKISTGAGRSLQRRLRGGTPPRPRRGALAAARRRGLRLLRPSRRQPIPRTARPLPADIVIGRDGSPLPSHL